MEGKRQVEQGEEGKGQEGQGEESKREEDQGQDGKPCSDRILLVRVESERVCGLNGKSKRGV